MELSPDKLELEITESATMEDNIDKAIAILGTFKNMGASS